MHGLAGTFRKSYVHREERRLHVLYGLHVGQWHPDIQHPHDIQPPVSTDLSYPELRPE